MKKIILFLTSLLLTLCYSSVVNAQDDISNIFKAGVTDLNKVANGYLKPAGNSFATGLGTNWYNTAAVHKNFGFDLTIGAGVIEAPLADQSFSLAGLTNLKPTIAGTISAPSFAGTGNGVELNLMQPHYLTDGTTLNPLWANGTGKITSFTSPAGMSKYIPTASVQFTIGLPYINDVSIRFIPTVNAYGFGVSMWGVGIKHNFKQWIPVVKALPFDASVLVAYNKFDLKYDFPTSAQITPDKLVTAPLTYIPDPTSNDYTKQGMKVSADAITANIIVSKKLAFITPYVGFGFTKTNFNLIMTGNYPTLGNPVLQGSTYKMQIANMSNPIQISSQEVMPNVTVGLRLKVLWIFSFHAQYTQQKYATASAGFGITIR